MLAVRRFGTGPPLVALHGFTLTGAQFAPASRWLRHTVVAPDLPGHGGSEPAALTDALTDITAILAGFDAPVPLLGYSQGGRLALLAALDAPGLVDRLVLVSATAGIADPADREARARADRALADRIVATTIDAFLAEWTTSGLTAVSHPDEDVAEDDRRTRRENTPSGLAAALVELGQGAQPAVWSRLGELTMPVLLVHGSRDDKYARIAHDMAAAIPDCSVVTIDGTGHNPLLEAPEVTYGEISRFLDGSR